MAKVKLIATQSLFGRFKMPYDKGNAFTVESEELAQEIVDAGYAEYAGKKKANDPPAPSELETLTAKAKELKIEVPEGADVDALKALIAEAEKPKE